MKSRKPLLAALGTLALTALPATAQVDFTRIAWLGDSFGAGFSSNCLARNTQVDSVGAIVARSAGVSYEQPIINEPGIGNCITLLSLAPSFGGKAGNGTPANLGLARPYNNLSVGGCAIHDMLVATTGAQARPGTCRNTLDLVLRNSVLNAGSMVDQAIALNPTFVFLENVGNDYLNAVLSGSVIDGVTMTPLASFTADYKAALAKLKAKQANGIVFGVADVTNIAFATTLPPVLTSGGAVVIVNGAPIPLLGPTGCPAGVPACPIPSGSLITLQAAGLLSSGFGIPCQVAPLPNCNKPLPDTIDAAGNPGVILYPSEVAALRTRSAEYNTAVQAAAAEVGYKYYDSNAFLNKMRSTGVSYGGMTVTASFLTGGFFSYDAFHLTSIGYALLADDLIKFINANFAANLKAPDLAPFFFQGNTTGGIPALAASLLSPAEQDRVVAEIFSGELGRSITGFIQAPEGRTATITPEEPSSPQTPQGGNDR